MTQIKERALSTLCYLTCVFYLVHLFFPSVWLQMTYGMLAAILFFYAFPLLSLVSKIVVVALIGIGGFCFWIEGASGSTLVFSFGQNLNIISMFLFIPFISTFLSSVGYIDSMKHWVQKQEQKRRLRPDHTAFWLTSIVGLLLNFGSLAIVKRIIEGSFSSFREQRLMLVILRGFGSCLLWSPFMVNIGLILTIFDLSWYQIGGIGLLMALIYIFLFWLFYPAIQFDTDPVIKYHPVDRRKEEGETTIKPFVAFSVLLIASCFTFDMLFNVNMVTIVTILAVLFPFLWAVVMKQVHTFFQSVIEQLFTAFTRLKQEWAIFVSAGFFAVALSETAFGTFASEWLYRLANGSVFIVSGLIILFAVILAQVGIHPVIVLTGIGSSISPEAFGISSAYLALVLIVSWTLSTQLSPFSGQVLLSAHLVKRPAHILIRRNIGFIFTQWVVLTSVLYGLHAMNWL
ncbi:hypothetical protein E2L07_16790 [Halalkalibacterium halodurans]|uniref:hypothetical protein n=1 Tax=Halalkalibacterium halodurans TaxID=86665 RepID=UPI001067323E|nr:hypothetical protein [Halalkalibacterium halodurans]MED4163609.1 hypothetical protein [Halalkalibacterium halodurans]TES50152.1 hypothetical protein E2L07_16790 [Halalkalibacterium halodurans]